MGESATTVVSILDRLRETAEQEEAVSLGHTVEMLGDRGWGPFLFVPALMEMSPAGAIPAVPTILASVIAIFAVQIALGREHLWLPAFLARRSIEGQKIQDAADKMRPAARWLDRWFHRRLPQLTTDKANRLAALLILPLCLTVPVLELVPFASTAPMAAIALVGLALTLRDGLLMALGMAIAAFAITALFLLSPLSGG